MIISTSSSSSPIKICCCKQLKISQICIDFISILQCNTCEIESKRHTESELLMTNAGGFEIYVQRAYDSCLYIKMYVTDTGFQYYLHSSVSAVVVVIIAVLSLCDKLSLHSFSSIFLFHLCSNFSHNTFNGYF